MKANISRQMTFLGLVALVFYTMLLSNGTASVDVMPQFALTTVFFLLFGRILHRALKTSDAEGRQGLEIKPLSDWALRTTIVNWFAVTMFACAITLFLLKPLSMTFYEFLIVPTDNSTFHILAP
jgi:hypothetical protein